MKYILISSNILKSKKDFKSLVEYCKYLYKYINKKYWNNKYPDVNIELLTPSKFKELGVSNNTIACCNFKRKTLYFLPKIWNLKDKDIIHFVKHEAAHYFEFYDRKNSNHGVYFKRLMKQMDEKGTKVADLEKIKDLDEGFKEEYNDREFIINSLKNIFEKQKQICANTHNKLDYEKCTSGTFAIVFREKTLQWVKGFFLNSNSRSKEFFCLEKNKGLAKNTHDQITIFKKDSIFEPSEKEIKELKEKIKKDSFASFLYKKYGIPGTL